MRGDLVSYEAALIALQDERKKLEEDHLELQRGKELLISKHDSTAAKWEAERHHLERDKIFYFVERIQAQNALESVRADLSEEQANVAEACMLSTENIEKARA